MTIQAERDVKTGYSPSDLERQMTLQLRRHLAGGDESSLKSAYELGRTARAGEVGVREMGASLFRAAFQVLADDGGPMADRVPDVESFLVQALLPFDGAPANGHGAHATHGENVAADGVAVRTDPLSPREREVLQRIADGFTNKEIARMLGISVKTVETHRGSLMRKLDIHATAGLVRYAIRRGLTDP